MLLALVAAAAASERAPALFLQWQAEEGCPDRAWVLAEVARLRGTFDVREAELGSDVVAHAAVKSAGARWTAEVQTKSSAGDGTRTLDADTCQRAAEAVAVVIALSLAPFVPPELPAPSVKPPATEP